MNIRRNIIFVCVIVVGAIVFALAQASQPKSYVSNSETYVSTTTPTPTVTIAPLSSADLTQDEFNQKDKEASLYLKANPQYKCPDVVTYYSWKLQFYKDNPQISMNEFSQRSNSLMQQSSYPYWACGVVFLKNYATQLGKYLQEHGYATVTLTPTPALSNDNHYTNSDGNKVHSPAYSEDNSVPVGATAQCSDGTYSFSQHRNGTCSHHGGVSTWF